MAWRIAESVVHGEIDNRLPGIIKGTLYLEGAKHPVNLELEGNCDPDLAGRHLTFRNLLPCLVKSWEGFGLVQSGTPGTMTAANMSRIPTVSSEEFDRCIKERISIPTRWSESLYLEWFSCNGRVLIEGSSFACTLSQARWKLSGEAHQWKARVKEARSDLFFDQPDTDCVTDGADVEGESGRPWIYGINRSIPHPLVRRTTDLMLQIICESKLQRFYVDEAIENYPLEAMIDAMAEASVRLAHVLADSHPSSVEFVHGLKRARWRLGVAAENTGLAKHMGSADAKWLDGVRRDLSELRSEISQLLREKEEESKPSSVNEAEPVMSSNQGNQARFDEADSICDTGKAGESAAT